MNRDGGIFKDWHGKGRVLSRHRVKWFLGNAMRQVCRGLARLIAFQFVCTFMCAGYRDSRAVLPNNVSHLYTIMSLLGISR